MPKPKLSVIDARANAATNGPWEWKHYENGPPALMGQGGDPEVYAYETEILELEHDGGCGCRAACTMTMDMSAENSALIAESRTDVPALVGALKAVMEVFDRHIDLTPEDDSAYWEGAVDARNTIIWQARFAIEKHIDVM